MTTAVPAQGRPAPDKSPPRTDRVLLFLLLLLNLGSAWTTVQGARQVLPSPLAEILGLTVQVMLFLLLAGATARHAPVRKWLVVGVFAAFSVYTSFFAYHHTLAGDAVVAAGLDQAQQAHATLMSELWEPASTRAEHLDAQAQALRRLASEEAAAGVTTGAVGYGPMAREYDAQAREKEDAAALVRRDLTRLAPLFEDAVVESADAAQIYAADLAAWQAAPQAWKADVARPTRAAYVDLAAQVDLLTPIHEVQRRSLPALVALMVAGLVDGICILLGTAITGRGRPMLATVTTGAATWVGSAKDGAAQVREAWVRPGVPRPLSSGHVTAPAAAVAEEVPLLLPLDGQASAFLGALYTAVDPESGELDLQPLLQHEDPRWRTATRLLVDRLRQPSLGWLVVRDGWWCVPPSRYAAMTGWLSGALAAALQAEQAAAAGDPPERVFTVTLPAAA